MIKKLIFKCTMMLVIFAGISQYFVYIMTGKSPLQGMKAPSLSLDTSSVENVVSGGTQTVYKWVDENGVTQYSAEPPPTQQDVKTLEVDPNTNLVQGLRMQEDEEEAKQEQQPQVSLDPSNIYSPGAVKKLVEDAKNVQDLLNERYDTENGPMKDL